MCWPKGRHRDHEAHGLAIDSAAMSKVTAAKAARYAGLRRGDGHLAAGASRVLGQERFFVLSLTCQSL